MTRRDGYLVHLEERVKAAHGNGKFRVRANPSACACPAFEIELGGVWQRADVVGADADDPVAVRLEEMVQTHDESVVVVDGHLESAISMCARGALYVSFVPTAFEPETPPEVPPSPSSERR